MKISLVQPDTLWEEKIRNFRALEGLIAPLRNNTDIVVLPEMFNSGFLMDPERLAEYPGQETYLWMKTMSEKGNFGLCGSYIVSENGSFFNRFVFVSPENESWHYDKRHLFGMAGENKYFSQGEERVTFSFRGMRILPLICYDLRFPVWIRNRNDIDLIILSANWPEKRKTAWNILSRARAIENQCFVAAVNRIGTDGNGVRYSGESMLINYLGDIIVNAESDREGTFTGEMSMHELSGFRTKFPFMNDADDFILNT